MTEANLDIVRQVYRRFNRKQIESLVESLDPEIVFEPGPEAGPFRTTCRGRDEVRDLFARLSKVVVKFEAEPRRFLVEGEDVFVLVQMYGKFSRGVEAWTPVIHQWTLEEGRIVRWKSHPSSGKPLEAELASALH
jgi:ketosteroid isomerase-like protein